MLTPKTQENDVWSVSQLSDTLKAHIEGRFGRVTVRGELSGVKCHSSGHLYFSLKDSQAVLASVSWRGMVSRFTFKPQDGMEVICQGRLTTYGLQSKYQLVVDHMTPSGQGSLLKILEDLKKKLATEGLFDASRKKPLPLLPKTIGIITSPTGAVIQDMLHRLEDRCPTHVLLWPVAVQGATAADQMAQAIQGFSHLAACGPVPRPDVLILARGGGSLEDLWSFNEECVVRAMAACTIPIITGVGHEPDVTLVDYVADHRAPTPTAAMERAVPVRQTLMEQLRVYERRLRLPLDRKWETLAQRHDDRTDRLNQALEAHLRHLSQRLSLASASLRHPKDALNNIQDKLRHQEKRLSMGIAQILERSHHRLGRLGALLKSYSHEGTLKRGFALVTDQHNQVVTGAERAKRLGSFSVTWHDGSVQVEPTEA